MTASKTTLTEVFGVGPIVAATVIGDVGDVSRFPSRDHFAAYNGTAPIEVSSGGRRKVFRLSRRGNRRLNHAIHMAAVTQIRHRHSEGRAYYDRKLAEGHSGKEAIRALKRRISDAIYARLRHDADQTPRDRGGPGRAPGERLCRQRGRLTPRTPALRPSHSRTRHHPTTDRHPIALRARRRHHHQLPEEPLDNKEDSIGAGALNGLLDRVLAIASTTCGTHGTPRMRRRTSK